ncbi:hypothetical protein A3744_01150 [Oleiphilus sp. HI0073]|nr:tetratricopeptide repeat protein [Oleiphilus sp. HI0080]KZY97816.1 hypothetical protein A3744_01150 [Oleiphilus sp. HI0073]KZZ52293.1 hypothetical protein A3760_00930 [Oleiphilus sp. HI0122]
MTFSTRALQDRFKAVALLALVCVYSGCATVQKPAADVAEVQDIEAEKVKTQQAFAAIVQIHKNGDIDDAKQGYEAFLERFPNNTAARINLSHIALQAEQYDQAGAYILEALQIDPKEPQALMLAGLIAREKGDFDGAESYYRQALSVNPDYIPAIRNLAILLDLYRGRLQEALELYERAQALETVPDPKLKDWIFDIKRRIGEP